MDSSRFFPVAVDKRQGSHYILFLNSSQLAESVGWVVEEYFVCVKLPILILSRRPAI
jgi:hypothetical protein